MVIDPKTINLTPEQRQRLAELVERTGRPWQEILNEALQHAFQPNVTTNTTMDSKSFFDVLSQDGAIGAVKDELPTDSATNPTHMEGFGRDR